MLDLMSSAFIEHFQESKLNSVLQAQTNNLLVNNQHNGQAGETRQKAK